ncbi:DNA-directed RNA polymerase subunit omega [Allofustis seminis]|uniref:DNA-directed RNA polymerase subunit omega n=1 Tax=Allofustis seminis TaxID=166939 RepID=UPI00036EA4F3|nr:DNA-directed RNA polymerase subunit omega [Allofustis seminis]
MLLYPSLDKLLEKIDSKYSLIILASKRAHSIDALERSPKVNKEDLKFKYKSVSNVGKALEEVAAGDLTIKE